MEVFQAEGSPRHKKNSPNIKMGEDAFNEKILTEKLSKLNSSQQSIESLSRWCITHRKKAKQVVETWETLFKSAPHGQRVSFLYLANDILQNSRRKGSEYVNEFWKVLPTAVKDVYDSGEENCRKVASRLVNIWEERKVFGSRGQNLKNELLGKIPSPDKIPSPSKNPPPVNNVKTPNPIRVLKRDSNSLRIKLAVGGVPEKIITAFQMIHEETVNEEVALSNCRNAVSCVQEIEKDVVNVSSQGNLLGSDVVDKLEKQENALQQCISQLEKIEAVRDTLVSQLKEALQAQESKLELIRSELLVARGQIEQAANTRLQLTSTSSKPPTTTNQLIVEPTFPPTNPVMPPPSFSNPPPISEEESNRAAAAALAAKLSASASSAQMLTSVLSSLVAEEAASMSSGFKKPKLDNSEATNSAYITTLPPVQTSMQPVSQMNQLQAPFLPPPPPPSVSMMGQQYGYASNVVSMGFARPGPGPPQQQAQAQQMQNQQGPSQQQLPASGGYYRPVGVGFYGQSHQPPTPPIHRQ